MPTSIPCHLPAMLLLCVEAELLHSLAQFLFATRVLRNCPNMCSCATYSISMDLLLLVISLGRSLTLSRTQRCGRGCMLINCVFPIELLPLPPDV